MAHRNDDDSLASDKARLKTFVNLRISHAKLDQVVRTLRWALEDLPANHVILIFGPTGVGKTTLAETLIAELIKEMLPMLEKDKGMILRAAGDVLIEYKKQGFSNTGPEQPGGKTLQAHRDAYVKMLINRKVSNIFVDNAMNIGRVPTGRSAMDQLNVLTSLADSSRTRHILLGTYELLQFRNLSDNLSRRCFDIHFPRYLVGDTQDEQDFANIINELQGRLPKPVETDLCNEFELIYRGSLGLISLLKHWLDRASQAAVRERLPQITLALLKRTMLPLANRNTILEKIVNGEKELQETDEDQRIFEERLGLESVTNSSVGSSAPEKKNGNRHPGKRNATRDKVGPGK